MKSSLIMNIIKLNKKMSPESELNCNGVVDILKQICKPSDVSAEIDLDQSLIRSTLLMQQTITKDIIGVMA